MTAPRLLVVLLLAARPRRSRLRRRGEPSVEDYAEAVVLNRNRADFVLARITRAQSLDELLDPDGRGGARDRARPPTSSTTRARPSDFQPEADNLVKSLRQLSVDVQATADQARARASRASSHGRPRG